MGVWGILMRRIAVVMLVAVGLLATHIPLLAQARSVFWQRWDVMIDNVDTTNNQFSVTEIYDVSFSGRFTFGSAVIPYRNLEDIRNIQVFDGGKPLRSSCVGQQAGTFCASRSGEELSITYYFLEPVNSGSRQIELRYDVIGALRIYEGGDQLWWDAIPEEHYGFSIGSSTITVQLPEGLAPREGSESGDPVVTYGAPSEIQVNGTTVVATATREIAGNESFSIRVQYPHDLNARVAGWQAGFDQQRTFEENVQPLLTIGLLILSLTIGLGGTLFIFTRWQTKGRDPKVGPVPTFLTDPPSQLRPAVVGSLLDERVDLRDIMSTLIDLAQRGYLVIEENQNEGLFGIGRTSEFTFKRTDKPTSDLRSFEVRLINKVFSSGLERSLNAMRNTFYTVIPQLQGDLYDELVTEGLFASNPNTTRNKWTGLGWLLLIGAGVVGFLLLSEVDHVSAALLCLPLSVGLVGIMAMSIGQAMPAKTYRGAEEAAKWRAFEEYLRNLDQYQGLEEAAVHFDAYLPYAVAFGLDRSWIRRFQQVDYVPIPTWYFPTYLGGPYGRGYTPGSAVPRSMSGNGGLPGELARAGDGGLSLDTMSGNLSAGLESISNGLSTMMESAARVMTSRPQQAAGGSSGSWRSGGSSWSGGGFSGGGGSGGGSRGFG
jgi:uncharacterized membrane protein YgcG